jgi:hypothetical protein
MPHLCFDACHVAKEILDGLHLLVKGFEPMVMGDHATPPLPDPLLGIQLRRIRGLGLEQKPPCRSPQDSVDWSAFMLGRSVMDHQQPFVMVIAQQAPQEAREFLYPQCGTDVLEGPACQGRDRPVDVDLCVIVSWRHLRDVIR